MPDPASDLALFGRFGAVLALGLLVGLQREYAKGPDAGEIFAGARTFALLGLVGALMAHLARLTASPAVLAVGLTLAGALVAVAYGVRARQGDIGLTTEVAALATVGLGALCVMGSLALAAAAGVATTALLASKEPARRFVRGLDADDVAATLKFAVLAAVVLPVLPRTPPGPPPFDVATPFKVGLMAVLISGIAFLGYVLIQVVGARRGVGLTGVLGGLVSSTAVTLSLAQRSRDGAGLERALALGIVLAWAIMFARVLVEVGAVNAALLPAVLPAVGAGGAVGLLYAAALAWRRGDAPAEEEPRRFSNPFRLAPALQFALLYGVILVASKAAALYVGTAGVYVSAVASGVADVDAITLSMADLSRSTLPHETAARAIALAAVSNTLVKGGLVVAFGSAGLRRVLVPAVALMSGATLALAFLG